MRFADASDRDRSTNESLPRTLSRRRAVGLGALAGAIGLGCCIYPVVLVLVGLSTATAAVDLGNRLFAEWGWAFKLVGTAFAISAVWIMRRRARACPVDARPRIRLNAAMLLGVGLGTYGVLYAVTTWLGFQAT